jgi:predicted ABC-type ATPase
LTEAKEFVVIGGPNGAGKTTYAHELIQAKAVPYLSADAIAGELSPQSPASSSNPLIGDAATYVTLREN